ncbi:MAG TPA: glycoside hydrolase family 3 N-terminal domain-containing protein [Gaiellales bacterium]|jgi:beta-N-acetylhexosaminidase
MPWRRHRRPLAGRVALCATAAACGLLGVGAAPAPPAAAPATPTLAQLVGQRLVVAITGTRANPQILARIRAGQVGGVILFGGNIASQAQVKALTASLRAAAQAGGRPRLIIATDQEGGEVKRLPWAPPNVSAQTLGTLGPGRSAKSGKVTGAALAADGVNVDLAPVADVPVGPADFIAQQHRAFSTDRFAVASDAAAFAGGLEQGGAWPTLKHFPGLGRARVSTDDALVRITASSATLTKGLLPYRVAFRRSLDPVVMLSTAVYPALDWRAAAWSPPIIHTILRGRLGFAGVTITDALDSAAAVRHTTDPPLALRSAQAGADLLLITGSQATSRGVYTHLLAAATSGALPMANLTASYNRILALKTHL